MMYVYIHQLEIWTFSWLPKLYIGNAFDMCRMDFSDAWAILPLIHENQMPCLPVHSNAKHIAAHLLCFVKRCQHTDTSPRAALAVVHQSFNTYAQIWQGKKGTIHIWHIQYRCVKEMTRCGNEQTGGWCNCELSRPIHQTTIRNANCNLWASVHWTSIFHMTWAALRTRTCSSQAGVLEIRLGFAICESQFWAHWRLQVGAICMDERTVGARRPEERFRALW